MATEGAYNGIGEAESESGIVAGRKTPCAKGCFRATAADIDKLFVKSDSREVSGNGSGRRRRSKGTYRS